MREVDLAIDGSSAMIEGFGGVKVEGTGGIADDSSHIGEDNSI